MAFLNPHLDYDHSLYDKPNNENFQKLEKVQYKACLAITGAIQGTSGTKLYDELGSSSLIKGRWWDKLIFLDKIVNGLYQTLFIFSIHISVHIWISRLK